jgi:hypothetical protein
MNYLKEITVKLTQSEKDLIIRFAEDTYEERFEWYSQFDENLTPEKTFQDIVTGKGVEMGARKVASMFGLKLTENDFRLLSSEERNYDYDFKSLNSKDKFLVKGCSYGDTFRYEHPNIPGEKTPSMLFNSWDDAIIHSQCNNEYVIAGSFDALELDVRIYGVFQAEVLRKKSLFEEPMSDSLKESKTAIYINKIHSCLTMLQSWGKLLTSRT